MPDYEIRYYHADGKLAVVQMTVKTSENEATKFAKENQSDHARFEIYPGSTGVRAQRR